MLFILFNMYVSPVAVCGALYEDASGTILSPGYPGNYANNLDCGYTIVTDPQKFVVIQFQEDYFGIEGSRKSRSSASRPPPPPPSPGTPMPPGSRQSGMMIGEFIWHAKLFTGSVYSTVLIYA